MFNSFSYLFCWLSVRFHCINYRKKQLIVINNVNNITPNIIHFPLHQLIVLIQLVDKLNLRNKI